MRKTKTGPLGYLSEFWLLAACVFLLFMAGAQPWLYVFPGILFVAQVGFIVRARMIESNQ